MDHLGVLFSLGVRVVCVFSRLFITCATNVLSAEVVQIGNLY